MYMVFKFMYNLTIYMYMCIYTYMYMYVGKIIQMTLELFIYKISSKYQT